MSSPADDEVTIVGIQVYYCDSTGGPKSFFVDIKSVEAISWTAKAVGKKDKDKKGNAVIPTTNKVPTCGPGPKGPPGGGGMCWWNGTDWICGDA